MKWFFCVPIPGLSARTSGCSQEVVMGKNQRQNKVKLNMIMNVITWIIIWQTKTGKQRTGNNHINVMYRIGLVTVETLYITFASMLQSTFLPLGLYYSPLFCNDLSACLFSTF